ncbi:6980_t:CDS:2 [Dentiscutata heterogama]|uniref:6980_t:CDS:1 n=1 Tax=Dentiscutata heterogama TaxID=1316150 RepID=A0ACA9K6D2_9GLOM|nr:6980_t:CDS:2 [Dentiscutata heterogama]
MEYAANNEYTEYATNNDDEISNDLVSETASSIQTKSSNNSGRPPADVWKEFNTINNEAGKHKGASCRYCKQKWSRGRAHEMKTHFVIKSIDKAKEKRANQSLIKWIVSSGISFSAFDNPYFEDYTKALNPGYDPPKRSALATSILDTEAAIENAKSELSYVKQNLHQEDLLSIFNKIANSIENRSDLFSEEESFAFLEEFAEENTEETEEELKDLANENSTNLEVRNFISLSSNLEPNETSSLSKEVIHRNKDFDIDDLISDLD